MYTNLPRDRSKVATESRHPETRALHKLPPHHVAALLLECSGKATEAAQEALPAVQAFLNDCLPRFQAGGRLILVGAGTSGRLAAAEAAEMPPTFQLNPDHVVGVIAGGAKSLLRSSEGKEDEEEGALPELERLGINENDSLIGITAGGTTPYVIGAIRAAQKAGALTALLTSGKSDVADHTIHLSTGAEPLTGSTRMNAATAAKVVLNTITTALMVAEGRIYDNLMIALNVSNEKLEDRALRILTELRGIEREEAHELLLQHNRSVRAALVDSEEKEAMITTTPSPFADFLAAPCEEILAIDGGGTKTALQRLAADGTPLDEVQLGGPLNIHDIGEEGVRKTLSELLPQPKNSLLVLGAAGAERANENATLQRLLAEQGYDRTWVKGDGDLLLDAVAPTGLILIAGTGSHCIGVHREKRARAGGLGRILGDEGSGYHLGLEAVRAALAYRYGWGEESAIGDAIKEQLQLSDLEELLHPINSSAMGKAEIASLAPLLLELAESDQLAKKLLLNGVDHLTKLVRHVLRQLALPQAQLHLVGGLFRSQLFLQELERRVPCELINIADEHPATWAVQRVLKK